MLCRSSSSERHFSIQLLALFALSTLLLLPTLAHAQQTVTREENVVFCSHNGIALSMDIAYPSNPEGTYPALIFISGSGWGHWWGYGFDRHQYSSVINTAAEHGYVAATVDYRPTPKHLYPSQLLDVRSAVRWLRAHSAKYHIDVNHLGAIGWSSGGHLALMLGLLDTVSGFYEEDNLKYSSKVQAVVSLAGPTELARMYREATYPGISDALRELIGGTPEQLPAKYREASPLYHVTSAAAPVLIIQGGMDTEVPPNQASLFAAEMKKVGASATIIAVETMGHTNSYNHESIYPFFDSVLKGGK